jgi:cobalt-zinc-cadmium efflux system outer membrane protein
LLAVAILGSALNSVRADVLTFDAALARALERSPAIARAASGTEVAAASLRSARAWENPTLQIESENVLGEGAYADFDAAETTVTLAQKLPLGGGRQGRIRMAEAQGGLAGIEAELARMVVRRDVAIAYAEAVAAERLARIERERAQAAAQTRAAVEQRFAAGLESELGRSRAEVESSRLQATSRRAAAEARERRRALAAQWRESSVEDELDGAWFDALPPPGTPLALATEVDGAAPATARVGHPRLRKAQLEVIRAQAALDAARGARFGGVEASVGTRRFGDEPGDGDQAFVLGLAMPLPVWDRNDAGIAEARAALVEAELDAELAARELDGERQVAEAALEAAVIEARALERSGLPASETAARLTQQGYDAGRLSLLERLNAERELADARERLELARLEVQRARARLESLSDAP